MQSKISSQESHDSKQSNNAYAKRDVSTTFSFQGGLSGLYSLIRRHHGRSGRAQGEYGGKAEYFCIDYHLDVQLFLLRLLKLLLPPYT